MSSTFKDLRHFEHRLLRARLNLELGGAFALQPGFSERRRVPVSTRRNSWQAEQFRSKNRPRTGAQRR